MTIIIKNIHSFLGYLYEQDYEKAFFNYQLSVKYPNSNDHYKLGCFYENGKGVKQDYLKAIEHYKLAADLNNSCGYII